MQLSISLLGHFSAALDEQEIPNSRTKKIEALLAYLVVESDYAHRRENLMGLLFPEMPDDVASTNLRQTLTRLRRAVNDSDAVPTYLITTRETIQFNGQSDHWSDLVEFELLLSGCVNHPSQRVNSCIYCMSRTREAVELYDGPFLKDFFLADSADFEDWAATHRERLQREVLEALSALASFYTRRGEYEQAIVYGRQQVAIERWHEEAHQNLMRLLARMGQRTDALAQFKRCKDALRAELDVEPSEATMALRDQVMNLAESRPQNLPVLDETFVGRNEELAQIHTHLTDQTTRLLTLVGAGGIGKTRLALEAGWRITQEHLGPFMHGVFFVSLADIEIATDPEQTLAIAVADSLDISLVGVKTPLNVVLGHIQDKELLLIVDNCEEAGDAIELLSKLLAQAPDLQILATSREPLDLVNEFLIHLDGLPFPPATSQALAMTTDDAELAIISSDDSSQSDVKPNRVGLESYQSVQLFAHHALRVESTFSWEQMESSEQQAIGRICQVCEGMPLALEMAAVWVQMLPCQEIASEIERNFDILQSSQRQRPARHHSIRAVFDYSWTRLTAAERTIFVQLSVFRGGFSREAAQEIAEATLPILASLVRKSLVRTIKSHKFDDACQEQARYALHPLLRQYAAEKLSDESTQESRTKERHGSFYCSWLHQQTPDLKGGAQQQAIATIAIDLENVRQAWQWAVANQHKGAIDLAVDGFTDFCELRGLFVEGEELLGQAVVQLQTAQREAEDDATAVVVAKTLARQGWMNFLLGDSDLAQRQLTEALGLLQVLEVPEEMVTPLNSLAYVAYCTDQYALALEKSGQAREMAEVQGDLLGQANALRTTASITQHQGRLQESAKLYEQALAGYQQIGNGQGACWSLLSLCSCAGRLGNFDVAIERGQEVVQVCREIRYRLGEGWATFGLGTYYVRRGDYAEAIDILEQAVRIGRDVNDRRLQGSVLHWQGICLRSQNESDQAWATLQQALEIFRDIDNVLGAGEVRNELGILERFADQYTASLSLHQQALEIGQRIGNHELQCRTFTCLGHVYVAMERYIQAQTAYEQALEHVDESQPQQRVYPLSGLAYVAAREKLEAQAESQLREIIVLLKTYRLNGADDIRTMLWYLARALDTLQDEQVAALYEPMFSSYQGIIAQVSSGQIH